MENEILITIEDPREFGLLAEMARRKFLTFTDRHTNYSKVLITKDGRKFLDKLINPIKQNNTEKN